MKIIGHRGASGYKPENTLSSFRQAIKLGVDMIEFDVYTVKSGEVMVLHDDKLDRTTNGTGSIESKTFTEIRKLDAGGGEKVPLLTEVLDTINKKVPINIELKGTGTAGPVAAIIQHYVTKKGWPRKLFLVSSFDHSELKAFTTLLPTIPTGALFGYLPFRFWPKIKDTGVTSANISAKAITRRAVNAVHAHGLEVYVYTVNSKRQADRMARLGVDGIFSNFPDKVSGSNGIVRTPKLQKLVTTKKAFARAS